MADDELPPKGGIRKRDVLAWSLLALLIGGLIYNIASEPHTLDTSVSYQAR